MFYWSNEDIWSNRMCSGLVEMAFQWTGLPGRKHVAFWAQRADLVKNRPHSYWREKLKIRSMQCCAWGFITERGFTLVGYTLSNTMWWINNTCLLGTYEHYHIDKRIGLYLTSRNVRVKPSLCTCVCRSYW